jgi:hypothetical protein
MRAAAVGAWRGPYKQTHRALDHRPGVPASLGVTGVDPDDGSGRRSSTRPLCGDPAATE